MVPYDMGGGGHRGEMCTPSLGQGSAFVGFLVPSLPPHPSPPPQCQLFSPFLHSKICHNLLPFRLPISVTNTRSP